MKLNFNKDNIINPEYDQYLCTRTYKAIKDYDLSVSLVQEDENSGFTVLATDSKNKIKSFNGFNINEHKQPAIWYVVHELLGKIYDNIGR